MSIHIVIAEDDEMLIGFLTIQLQRAGYQVSGVTTGAEVFPILDSQPVDLIIMDLGLPDGDGLSRCQQIRERSSVPIVVLTGRRGLDDRLMALGLGVDDYIMKPCDPQELLLRVRNILGRTCAAAPVPVAPRPAAPLPTGKTHRKPIQGGKGRGRRTADLTAQKAHRLRPWRIAAGLLFVAAASGGGYWFSDEILMAIDDDDVTVALAPVPVPIPVPVPASAPPTSHLTPPLQTSPSRLDDTVTINDAATRTISFPALPAAQQIETKTETETDSGEVTSVSVQTQSKTPLLDKKSRNAAAQSYSWVMKSKCAKLPVVSWWKVKTHTQMARFVNTRLGGDWRIYIDTWTSRMVKLQRIYDANGTIRSESGEVLSGSELKTYIDKTRRRVDITFCLYRAATDFTYLKSAATR